MNHSGSGVCNSGLKMGLGRTGSETRHSLIYQVYTGSLVYSFSAHNYRILQINKGAVSEQCSSRLRLLLTYFFMQTRETVLFPV